MIKVVTFGSRSGGTPNQGEATLISEHTRTDSGSNPVNKRDLDVATNGGEETLALLAALGAVVGVTHGIVEDFDALTIDRVPRLCTVATVAGLNSVAGLDHGFRADEAFYVAIRTHPVGHTARLHKGVKADQ